MQSLIIIIISTFIKAVVYPWNEFLMTGYGMFPLMSTSLDREEKQEPHSAEVQFCFCTTIFNYSSIGKPANINTAVSRFKKHGRAKGIFLILCKFLLKTIFKIGLKWCNLVRDFKLTEESIFNTWHHIRTICNQVE